MFFRLTAKLSYIQAPNWFLSDFIKNIGWNILRAIYTCLILRQGHVKVMAVLENIFTDTFSTSMLCMFVKLKEFWSL